MKILGQQITFKDNILFSINTYQIRWAVLLLSMLFDYMSTLYFISESDPSFEANHIIRYLIEMFEVEIGVFIGKFMQLISVIVFTGLDRNLGAIFLLLITLLNIWATCLNLI